LGALHAPQVEFAPFDEARQPVYQVHRCSMVGRDGVVEACLLCIRVDFRLLYMCMAVGLPLDRGTLLCVLTRAVPRTGKILVG